MMIFAKKQGRFKATKTVIDGYTFASKREANRYQELKFLEQAGEITNLRLQVPFELQPKCRVEGKAVRAITYIADFVYEKDGVEIVEDSKGFKTTEYRLKAKMFAYKYGKFILET